MVPAGWDHGEPGETTVSLKGHGESEGNVAFRRANVEHGFRVCKTELGFTHFEGRNYGALMRHMSLCLTAMGFVAEHTERLRGEKPGVDDGAGVPGVGGGVPPVAATAAGER